MPIVVGLRMQLAAGDAHAFEKRAPLHGLIGLGVNVFSCGLRSYLGSKKIFPCHTAHSDPEITFGGLSDD